MVTKVEIDAARESVETIATLVEPHTRKATESVLEAFSNPFSLETFVIYLSAKGGCIEFIDNPKVVQLIAMAMSFGYAMALADQQR